MMPKLLVHSAALIVILSPVFCAPQLPQRLENCLPIPTLAQEMRAMRAKQQAQDGPGNPERPPKIIRINNLTLKSDGPLPKTEREVKAELEAAPPIEDRSDWPEDLAARVKQMFQHWGYFTAAVELPYVETLSDSNQQELVNITLEIAPGRQYRTGDIKFVKGTQFDQQQLRDFFPLGPGNVLDTYKIGKGMERLRAAYGERGFINFAAAPNATLDEAHGTVSLTFDLDEGPQFRVGKFEILGLDSQLADRLIENSGLEPGSIFNPKLVELFFERNRDLLPSDAKAEDDTVRTLDEQRRIVNLRMDFRQCPTVVR